MNTSTLTLETKIKTFCDSLLVMNNQVQFLAKYYFSTGASTLVSALATDGTPATVSTALTKGEVVAGITMVGELIDFFSNAAVTTGDYQLTVDNLINGSNPASGALSQDVEVVGEQLKEIGNNLIELNKQATNFIGLYNSSQLSAIIGTLSSSNIVFGCSTTAGKMISGIVVAQQLQAFLGNSSVTTGDYLATIVDWSLNSNS